jgi:hypothetical protein
MSKRGLSRVEERPAPSQWDPDELLTLTEAAALFWPTGLIKTAGLRTAVREKKLEIAVIAGKHFTSPSAIGRMSRCALRQDRADPTPRHRDKPDRGRPPGSRSVSA